MKDLYQVLRQKELDLERIRKEIEALRFVTPLLLEDKEVDKNVRASIVPAPSQSRRTSSGD
jgi:ribosomal protein S25